MTRKQFQAQVITALLAGEDPLLETLRQQYELATMGDEQETPNGFILRFDVAAAAMPIDRKDLHLDDLQVELEGARTPADCSLHVDNGRLRTLECSVYEGEFPREPVIRAAWYYGTERFPGITPELLAAREIEELLEEE